MTARQSQSEVSRALREGGLWRLGYVAAAVTFVSACGIGRLDKGDRKEKQASAQIQAVTEAYSSKNKGVSLPKGGPGKGTTNNTPLSRRSDTGPGGEKEEKSFRRRVGEFFKLVSPRRHVALTEEEPPKRLRGLYALSDSGDFFVPCGDSTQYHVEATTEARYLMIERMRFIVRGVNTPVYAVFTASVVKPADPAVATQAKPGKKPVAAAKPRKYLKTIYVTKVDTLTNVIPSTCRVRSSSSRAANPSAYEGRVNPGPGPERAVSALEFSGRGILLSRFL
ncbi:MAG: hypothetical protein U0132_15600 [Gemmatimonadaceae bacterium]